ncbi:MAG: NAD(P)H-dependent oxidoreductase [Flavobacteriaceae bacterium]
MKILLVTAHPVKHSLCEKYSDTIAEQLKSMRHDVVEENLYESRFDPVLSQKEREDYYKEPYDTSAITGEVERLTAADALVLVFPTWWFGFPAILKGWFDRVWVPGVAYDHADESGPIKPKLHNIKKVFVVTTLGAPWWVDTFILRRPVKRVIKMGLLGSCARPCQLRFISFYKCEKVDAERLKRSISKIENELSKFLSN